MTLQEEKERINNYQNTTTYERKNKLTISSEPRITYSEC
jgi:hypothetical protein